MKKVFILGAIMLMGVSATFVSCKKDSIENGCTCTATVDGEPATQEATKAQLEELDIKSCSAFAAYLKEQYKVAYEAGIVEEDITGISCKGK